MWNFLFKKGLVIGLIFLLSAVNFSSLTQGDNLKNNLCKLNRGWTVTEVVSTESTSHSSFPSIAVESNGAVHVAWRDLTNYGGSGPDFDIFYKYREVSGVWSTTEVVSTESTDESREPSLAVDSSGIVHVAWCDYTNYGGSGIDKDIFYKIRDATGIWSTTEVVSTESTDDSYAPSLAVGNDGTVHIAWYDQTNYAGSGNDYDIFYKNKSSYGTWSVTEVVSTESINESSAPSLSIENPSKVHIAWNDNTDINGCGADFDIFYKYKDGSWITTEVVSTESTGHSFRSTLKVDSDSNIHVIWDDWTDYSGAGSDEDIFYKVKKSSGWSTTEVVSTESNEISYQSTLEVTSSNVHVTWKDMTDYGGSGADADIFYKSRGSSSWITTEIVSTESTAHSEWPSIYIDTVGTIHFAWGDMTDYGGAGTDNDIFYKNYSAGGFPDLQCDGTLSWTNIKPGSQVTGTFTVENVGDPGSTLDWEIKEWPNWGTWTFSPTSGTGLMPSHGSIDIFVSVTAPTQQNKQFTGIVRVNSLTDASDYCEIDAYLKTPRYKQYINNPFLKIFDSYICFFPILKILLQLFE